MNISANPLLVCVRLLSCIGILIFCFSVEVRSQNPTPAGLTQQAFDSLVRKGFTQIATGQNDAPTLTNYAAFSPADGKFSFNGFVQPTNSLALSLTAAGGMIGDNIGGLFDGGKLNKNSDLSLRLHLRVDKPSAQYDSRHFEVLTKKLEHLTYEEQVKLDKAYQQLDAIPLELATLPLKIDSANAKIDTLKNRIRKLQTLGLPRCTTVTFYKCRLKLLDSIATLNALVLKETTSREKLKYRRDSLKYVDRLDQIPKNLSGTLVTHEDSLRWKLFITFGMGKNSLRDSLRNALQREYKMKALALEAAIPIPAWHISWITFVGNWNRKVYRTFDSTLPATDQIAKHDFNRLNFGVEFNMFHNDMQFKRSSFLNIGVLRKENINLEDLSTSKVIDELLTPVGLANRKSSTEYTVYTDSIEQYKLWNVYGNYYRTFGKKMSMGIHLFGDVELRDNDDVVCDAGIGYFFGFFNKDKKQIINTEVFIRFNDLTDEVDEDGISFFRQTQIGLSVAVPLLFIKN